MYSSNRRTLLKMSALTLAASSIPSKSAPAKEWPTRPVTVTIAFPPGGTADNLGRMVSNMLSQKLGQPFIINNKAGAGGLIGTDFVLRSKPDGYTLLLGTTPVFTTLPVLQKMNREPLDAVDVVGQISGYVPVLAVNPQLKVKTLKELIELAKSKPGKLTYGSIGGGNPSQLNVEFFKKATGIDILHVPFKGSSEVLTALLGSQIDMMCDGITVPAAQAGRLVPLATFYKTRHPALPDIPTVEEAGVKTRLSIGTFGIFAPKGLPPAIMAELQSALKAITTDPSLQAKTKELSMALDWSPGMDYRRVLEEDLKLNRELLPALGVTSAQ